MSDTFVLTRQLGLTVDLVNNACGHPWRKLERYEAIRATDLESLLERGVRVYSSENLAHEGAISTVIYHREDTARENYATHTALLVNVQPIVRDTAEGLLREMEKIFATSIWRQGDKKLNREIGINNQAKAWDLLERARALLQEK